MKLAQAELQDKGKKAGLGAGMFGASGVVAFLGAATLIAAIVLAIATALDAWLAALIVAVVYGIAAAVLAKSGQSQIKEAAPAAPEQTVETLKEDAAWAKEQIT